MLEVEILKVKHKTQEEARKLLPYIQKTDVHSMEAPMTEESAQFHENDWYKTRSENWSRSMFERVTRYVMKELDPEIFDFCLAERSYTYRQRLPILFLERHTPDNLKKINELVSREHNLILEGITLLEKGKVDEFLQRQWEGIQAQAASVEMRDRNIGNNLDQAEQIIREKYGELKNKKPLRLTVSIGSRHAPEKYTSIPVSVHYLRGEAKDPTERLAYVLEKASSFEELTPYMLAYGAQQLINLRKTTLTLKEIKEITTDELYKRLSS